MQRPTAVLTAHSAVRRLSSRRRPDAAKHSRGPGAPLWACRCSIFGRSRPDRVAISSRVLHPASLRRAARHAHLRSIASVTYSPPTVRSEQPAVRPLRPGDRATLPRRAQTGVRDTPRSPLLPSHAPLSKRSWLGSMPLHYLGLGHRFLLGGTVCWRCRTRRLSFLYPLTLLGAAYASK